MKKLFLLGIVALGFTAVSFGQTNLATATIRKAITINNTQNLSFGTFSVTAAAGDVSINTAGTGDWSTTTPANTIKILDGKCATYSVVGDNNGLFYVVLPPAATTLDDGQLNTMTIASTAWATNLADNILRKDVLSATGTFTLKVGATVQYPINTPAGTFSKTYAVTVAYQ